MRFVFSWSGVGGFVAFAFAGLSAIAGTNDQHYLARPGIVVVPAAAAPSTHVPVAQASAPRAVATTETMPPATTLAARSTWWRPAVADTWQWQLTGKINVAYDVTIYDIDLFDAPDATIDLLRARGHRIVCYFSAGSSENWRPDFKRFAAADMGSPLDGWQGERWLDVRSQNVRRIMKARLDLAVQRKCDGVEPDNMDGYANNNGVGLVAEDQLAYNRFLATEAHRRGLAIGLKNDLDQIPVLVNSFDFAVNEQCNQYRECNKLRPFVAAGKPVFNAEYQARYRDNINGARDTLCAASRAAKFRTLILPLKLNDKTRYSCDAPAM